MHENKISFELLVSYYNMRIHENIALAIMTLQKAFCLMRKSSKVCYISSKAMRLRFEKQLRRLQKTICVEINH